MIGTTLAHYRILSRLGAGGMGEVYRARDTSLERDVALKVLPADVAADPVRRDRFRREALAVAALNHPHVVTIHAVEPDGDVPFSEAKKSALESFERAFLLRALREHDGNISRTAEVIGIARESLSRKIKSHKIEVERE